MKNLVVVLLVSIGLAGCTEYLDRREAVSLGAGDAQQANETIQVVNPLPPYAADTHLVFDGQVMQRAARNYRTGQTAEAEAPSSK